MQLSLDTSAWLNLPLLGQKPPYVLDSCGLRVWEPHKSPRCAHRRDHPIVRMFLGQSVWFLQQAVSLYLTLQPPPPTGEPLSLAEAFHLSLCCLSATTDARSSWLRWMWACFHVCPQSWLIVVIAGPLISLNTQHSCSRGTLVRSWLLWSVKYQSENHDCPLLWGQTA